MKSDYRHRLHKSLLICSWVQVSEISWFLPRAIPLQPWQFEIARHRRLVARCRHGSRILPLVGLDMAGSIDEVAAALVTDARFILQHPTRRFLLVEIPLHPKRPVVDGIDAFF